MFRQTLMIAKIMAVAAWLPATPAVAEEEAHPQDPFWNNAACRNSSMPRSVISKRLEGHVKALFDITKDGKVENIRIVESVPNDLMDYSVTRALGRWEYFMYHKDGYPMPRKDVPVTFTFGEEQEQTCTHSALPERPSTLGDPADPYLALKQCFKLMMPQAARRDEGAVTLSYDITADGDVENAKILTSPEGGDFDQEALNAVKRWHYHPFIKVGKPVARKNMEVTLYFRDLPEGAPDNRCTFAPKTAVKVTKKRRN
ncbi:MAG: energy transducer TonB [Alphaproteobacteria bacterium]|nr:energy transducer TonB [Alphaproteobacteria bacterium]